MNADELIERLRKNPLKAFTHNEYWSWGSNEYKDIIWQVEHNV